MYHIVCDVYIFPSIRFGNIVHFTASTGKEADASCIPTGNTVTFQIFLLCNHFAGKQFLIGFLQVLKLHNNFVIIFLRSHILLKDFILFFRFVQQKCLIDKRKIIPISFSTKVVQFFMGSFRSFNTPPFSEYLGQHIGNTGFYRVLISPLLRGIHGSNSNPLALLIVQFRFWV